MGSSAEPGKKISMGHRSSFWIKQSFGIGHPPAIHQLQYICVGEGSRVPNLQTEFNYLDSFKSNGIFSDFVVPVVPVWSPSSPHRPHSPQKVPCGPHHPRHPRCPCCPQYPHIVPIIPMSSPSSPHHLEGPQIIPNPLDSHPTSNH